jgi:hypothetical protein
MYIKLYTITIYTVPYSRTLYFVSPIKLTPLSPTLLYFTILIHYNTFLSYSIAIQYRLLYFIILSMLPLLIQSPYPTLLCIIHYCTHTTLLLNTFSYIHVNRLFYKYICTYCSLTHNSHIKYDPMPKSTYPRSSSIIL